MNKAPLVMVPVVAALLAGCMVGVRSSSGPVVSVEQALVDTVAPDPATDPATGTRATETPATETPATLVAATVLGSTDVPTTSAPAVGSDAPDGGTELAIVVEPTDAIPADDWNAIVDLLNRELLANRQCLAEMPDCDPAIFDEFGDGEYIESIVDYYADEGEWAGITVEEVGNYQRRIAFEGTSDDAVLVDVCDSDATVFIDEDGSVLADELYSWRMIFTIEGGADGWRITGVETIDEGTTGTDNVCGSI